MAQPPLIGISDDNEGYRDRMPSHCRGAREHLANMNQSAPFTVLSMALDNIREAAMKARAMAVFAESDSPMSCSMQYDLHLRPRAETSVSAISDRWKQSVEGRGVRGRGPVLRDQRPQETGSAFVDFVGGSL